MIFVRPLGSKAHLPDVRNRYEIVRDGCNLFVLTPRDGEPVAVPRHSRAMSRFNGLGQVTVYRGAGSYGEGAVGRWRRRPGQGGARLEPLLTTASDRIVHIPGHGGETHQPSITARPGSTVWSRGHNRKFGQ
jgi:hypothetical protein